MTTTKNKSKLIYKESDAMIKKPKGYKQSTDNLPDMKKVKEYYSKTK